MQAWIVVGSPANFELLRDRNFELCAFKASRQKQSSEMSPGDRIVHYLTGDVRFGGIVEVTGPMFQDTTDLGLRSQAKAGEEYPYRIPTRPVVILDPQDYIDVRDITALLDKTRTLGPKKLGIAFRGNLHRISDSDYASIERLMREQVGAKRPA